MSAAASIAAAQAARRRKLVRHFQSQGAVSAAHAIAEADVSPLGEHTLRRLRDDGVVRIATDGRLWLDEQRLHESDLQRRLTVARILAVVAVLGLLAALAVFVPAK